MLHSESFENVSPLWKAEVKWLSTTRQWWGNRVLDPKLDIAVSIGGSSVAVVTGRKRVTFPAMLALDTKGRVTCWGEQAAALEGREPEGISILQPIRGGVIYDPGGAIKLLEAALKKRISLGGSPNLLLAVSSQTAALETQSWLELGRQAGAHQTFLVSQLLAAALGAGVHILQPQARLVVHVGAGGCEAGVVALGSTLKVSRSRTGGDVLTEAIREHIRHQHGLVVHRQVAEKLKHQISLYEEDSEAVLEAWGRRVEDGQPACMPVLKVELANVVRPLAEQWCTWVHQFLSEVNVDWIEDIREGGVQLTGGSSMLGGFSRLLEERVGLRVSLTSSAGEACSLGMSRILGIGEVRHALLAPRPASIPKDDYLGMRAVAEPVVWRRLALATILAATVGLSFQSAYATKGTGGDPVTGLLSKVLIPGLATMHETQEQQKKSPEANFKPVLASQQEREIKRLSAENQRLWKWLGRREVTPQARWLAQRPILAQVIGRDPRGWFSSWTLDVGKNQNVKMGQVVMAESGLVGKIVSVEDTSCIVRPFVDSESVVAGQIPERKTSGIVLGRGTPNLEMRYLDPNSGIKVGDRVVTSGQDGQLPAGVVIGQVSQLVRQLDSSFVNAVITPAVRLDDVREVLILRGASET